MRKRKEWLLGFVLVPVIVFVWGCGSGRSGAFVTVNPLQGTVQAGETLQFTAQVFNVVDKSVTWSTDGGSITDTGLYTAPVVPGLYHVTATSVGRPAESQSVPVAVTQLPNTAVRVFSSPTYAPGQALMVSILVKPAPGVSAYAVEQSYPTGWLVTNVSDAGAVDANNQKVKWYFLDGTARTLKFSVTPPAGATGPGVFEGTVAFDADPPLAIVGTVSVGP